MRQTQLSRSKLCAVRLQDGLWSRVSRLQYWLRLAAPALPILLMPLLLFVVIVCASVWRMNMQDTDIKDAPLKTGAAIVVGRSLTYYKSHTSVQWQFRINGHPANTLRVAGPDATEDERLIWTKVGDTVPVTYRIGRSGAIYIENWQAPPHKISLSH